MWGYMSPEQHNLASTLVEILGLSPASCEMMAHEFSPAHFDRGESLVKANSVNGCLYFICRGLVRFVYVTEDGRELNKSFAAEHNFVGCLRSILTRQVCRFSIQALEPTHVLYLTDYQRESLWETGQEWQNLGRILAEQLALKKEEREAQFLLDSVEKRYLQFIAENADLTHRIPQYHIASYLGVTDVALSRIRKRLKAD